MKKAKESAGGEGPGRVNLYCEVARLYPLSTFFLTACIFSWSLWALMMASGRGLLPFPFPVNPAGSFGPAVAAFLLAACHPGEARGLLRSLLRWRMSPGWYALTLLTPSLLWAVGLLVYLLLGGSLPPASNWGRLPWLPVYFLAILVLGGPLGEEPGWRGVVLPRLLARMNALAASAVLAVLWLVWHLPLFWLEGSSQKGSSILLFAAAVAAYAVMFTWVYLRTGGNLLAVILFHTGVNTASFVLGAVYPALDSDARFSGAFTGVLIAAALALVLAQRDLFLARAVPSSLPSPGKSTRG